MKFGKLCLYLFFKQSKNFSNIFLNIFSLEINKQMISGKRKKKEKEIRDKLEKVASFGQIRLN